MNNEHENQHDKKVKAEWKKCCGEAHTNPYIDNCMVCMPYWEFYPICPIHKYKLRDKGWCKECRKHYKVEENNYSEMKGGEK